MKLTRYDHDEPAGLIEYTNNSEGVEITIKWNTKTINTIINRNPNLKFMRIKNEANE